MEGITTGHNAKDIVNPDYSKGIFILVLTILKYRLE